MAGSTSEAIDVAERRLGREIIKETEIDGCRLREEQMVMLAFGAANREPAMFSGCGSCHH